MRAGFACVLCDAAAVHQTLSSVSFITHKAGCACVLCDAASSEMLGRVGGIAPRPRGLAHGLVWVLGGGGMGLVGGCVGGWVGAQTGSGKTFTMEGTDADRGINPRTLARLFEQARRPAEGGGGGRGGGGGAGLERRVGGGGGKLRGQGRIVARLDGISVWLGVLIQGSG